MYVRSFPKVAIFLSDKPTSKSIFKISVIFSLSDFSFFSKSIQVEDFIRGGIILCLSSREGSINNPDIKFALAGTIFSKFSNKEGSM